jgi:hypothetical protein
VPQIIACAHTMHTAAETVEGRRPVERSGRYSRRSVVAPAAIRLKFPHEFSR